MCWVMLHLINKLAAVSVAGCLGYDVLESIKLSEKDKDLMFQLLVV